MELNPVISMLGRKLRLAVISGGPGSFGAMHRQAPSFDVICDKPMTNTLREAEVLHTKAEESGRYFVSLKITQAIPWFARRKRWLMLGKHVGLGGNGARREVSFEYRQFHRLDIL